MTSKKTPKRVAKRVVKTLPLVALRKACKEQRAIAQKEWPDGIPLTEATAAKVVELDLDMDWIAANILTDGARAEYKRVSGAALAEYRRVSGAAHAEYQRVSGPAYAEYERVRGPALAEYERVSGAAYAEYERVSGPALAEYDRVRALALLAGVIASLEAGA